MQRKSELSADPVPGATEGVAAPEAGILCMRGLKRIVRRYKKHNQHGSMTGFSDKICIQVNDTHPRRSVRTGAHAL